MIYKLRELSISWKYPIGRTEKCGRFEIKPVFQTFNIFFFLVSTFSCCFPIFHKTNFSFTGLFFGLNLKYPLMNDLDNLLLTNLPCTVGSALNMSNLLASGRRDIQSPTRLGGVLNRRHRRLTRLTYCSSTNHKSLHGAWRDNLILLAIDDNCLCL